MNDLTSICFNFFESSTKLHELQEKSSSIFKLRNGGSS